MAKFKKGQSGNPKGRPVGVPDKRTELRKRFEVDGSKVAAAVIEQALKGDMQAARLVLERIAAPIRATQQAVRFELDPEASLTDTAKQILTAISDGEVPPDIGKSLLDSVASMARVKELDEINQRLEELENGCR